jgi:hypothetical protein
MYTVCLTISLLTNPLNTPLQPAALVFNPNLPAGDLLFASHIYDQACYATLDTASLSK